MTYGSLQTAGESIKSCVVLHLPFLRVLLCLPLLKPFGLPLWLPKALNFIAALLSNQTALFQILKLSLYIETRLCRCFSAHALAYNNIQGKRSYITTETVTHGLRMRERRSVNGVGNGAHRCSVFVIVVPRGETVSRDFRLRSKRRIPRP